MIYKAIGLMSGSSLDGLDIAFVQLEEVRGKWSYQLLNADCVQYSPEWEDKLLKIPEMSVREYSILHTEYGRYLGDVVNKFIADNDIEHQVTLIASHGHTVMHEPEQQTSVQLGDGAGIAAKTGLPVVSDLRNMDVALGGQGAPIVPIGDKLLFSDYDYLLNLGGIANLSVPYGNSKLAFDLCIANQALNALANKVGATYDKGGKLASEGKVVPQLLEELKKDPYYAKSAPKSLSNEYARASVLPKLVGHSLSNLMRTMMQLIVDQVVAAIKQYPVGKEEVKLLVTGGGANNTFLIEVLKEALAEHKVILEVPDADTVNYKEAIVMALIGVLRWREETNVLSTVTGAQRDSISGAVWMGHSYS